MFMARQQPVITDGRSRSMSKKLFLCLRSFQPDGVDKVEFKGTRVSSVTGLGEISPFGKKVRNFVYM
jgi:hypothetical protein